MDRFTVRRKLLRGSLSAPLVLTVTAAGANVNTTFGACLNRTAGQAPPLEKLADVSSDGLWHDTWYRVVIWVTQVQTTAETRLYIEQFAGGQYFKLAATAPYTTVPEGPMALPSGTTTPEFKKVAALAFFDMHGNVIGRAWEPNGGAFTTKSCYGSVYGH